jgi:hypothetical protein
MATIYDVLGLEGASSVIIALNYVVPQKTFLAFGLVLAIFYGSRYGGRTHFQI